MGGENSLYKGAPAIHNGADDNGSGTTLLLEAIRYYGKRQDTNYNYVILFLQRRRKWPHRLEILH
jgi:Zn-dependent M28 family amino/carboxypeptidase